MSNNWGKYERAAEKGPFSIFWKLMLLFIGISVVCTVVGVVSYPFIQARRVYEKTLDADNVIYNYEWFKQRYEDIDAIDSKIVQAKAAVEQFKVDAGERKDWDRMDKEEFSRLSSVELGLNQQRADIAAEYNARSRMANRKIFKMGDTELPQHIPTN